MGGEDCTGHSGTSLPVGHPGKAGTTVGAEKHQVSLATAKKGSHPIPSHPIPSHPIPSHPIPSHPIPHLISSHLTPSHASDTTSTRSEHTQRGDETRRQLPRGHRQSRRSRAKCQGVPSARASQVPRRQAEGRTRKAGQARRARAASTHNETTRRTGRFHGSTVATITCQVPRRAKCQGEPSAKAPGRSATTTRRNTQAPATDPLARQERTTTHRGQDARAKCQEEQSSKKQCSWRTFMWAMPCGWEICAPCTDRTRAGRAARRCISHGRACAWSRARWSEGAGVAAREAHHTFLPRCGILRRSMHMLMEATTAARKRLSNGLVRRVSR